MYNPVRKTQNVEIMKPKSITKVPNQIKGSFHDTESQKNFESADATISQFKNLKERFFNINQWKSYCGEGFADFKLFDSDGVSVERDPIIGDYIRIDIPGPGNFEAKGFDWVEIVDIDQNIDKVVLESYIMICRPSKTPLHPKTSHIAHFYSDEGTSSFIICRGGQYIKAGIYGRNEYPNLNAGFLDKMRNILIGVGGMMGISKIQWKRLTDGLLDIV